MSLFVRVLIILTLTWQMNARASEGFFSFPKTEGSQKIWDSTVAIRFGDKTAPIIFSGTIVNKLIKGADVYYGILTSAHSLLRVNEIGNIADLRVSKSLHFVEHVQVIEELRGTVVSESLVINTALDLGYFVVKAKLNSIDFAEPTKLSGSCSLIEGDNISLIGFPAASIRSSKDQSVKIVAPKLITKRLSEGKVTSIRIIRKQDSPITTAVYFVGTSADSIEGNSGGPAFDKMGDLFGVLIGAASGDRGRYVGSDDKGSKAVHSVITPCLSTKDFVVKAWMRYLMTKN